MERIKNDFIQLKEIDNPNVTLLLFKALNNMTVKMKRTLKCGRGLWMVQWIKEIAGRPDNQELI